MNKQAISIRLKAYDHTLIDRSASMIVSTLNRVAATVIGPIPLPRSIRRITVLRAPHVFKKSREQFEKRIFKRLIYVSDLTPQAIETLMDLDVPSGVNISVARG